MHSWLIWQRISCFRWHEKPVKAMPNEDIPFWTSVQSWVKGDWWKTVFTTVTVALIVLLCGPCILQCIMNFATQRSVSFSQTGCQRSQGAIYPCEWCPYYELRASKEGNEGGNRQSSSILKAGLHLGPDCGLWVLCPVSMETNWKIRSHPPTMEEPHGSYLDFCTPKRIP